MLRLVKIINILLLLMTVISIIATQLWLRYPVIRECYLYPEKCKFYTYGYHIRDAYMNFGLLETLIIFLFYLPGLLLASFYVIFKKEEYNRKFWFFFITFVFVMVFISLDQGVCTVVIFRE